VYGRSTAAPHARNIDPLKIDPFSPLYSNYSICFAPLYERRVVLLSETKDLNVDPSPIYPPSCPTASTNFLTSLSNFSAPASRATTELNPA
jgi:hypothetical protein